MKVAKSYKLIVLIVAFMVSMACAVGFMNVSTARAETEIKAENYFTINSETDRFSSDGLNIKVQDGKIVSFKNGLIVNELSLNMQLPKGFTTSFVFDLDSFYVNGNPKNWDTNREGTIYEENIKNIVRLSYDGSRVDCWVNDAKIDGGLTHDNGKLTLDFGVIDNYLTVNNINIKNKYSLDDKIYYRIKNVDDKVVVENLTFDFVEIDEDAPAEEKGDTFVLEWVSQKRNDENYKQYLKLEDGQTTLTPAYPRVYVNEDFYVRNEDGSYNAVKKNYETKYKLDIKVCSVLGGYSNLYLVNPAAENQAGVKYDKILIESDTTVPNELRFYNSNSDVMFGIGEVVDADNGDKETRVYEEFAVEVVDDSQAPNGEKPAYFYFTEQLDNEIAYASFLNAVKKATTVEKEGGRITSVGLGTNFVLPSMKDLVSDDIIPYEQLTSKIYYRTVNASENSTNSFELNYIGDYIFFVTFSDGENEIKEKDFFVVEKDGSITSGIYGEDSTVSGYVGNFVFRFEIEDNADIEVKAAKQGKGYQNVKYKASKFTIDADGCIINYQLFYCADVNAEFNDQAEWVEILKSDLITDLAYTTQSGGFNYEEIKKIAYDGELTFVPTRIGSYKIVCTATSSFSSRETESSAIIKVESAPKVVEAPSKWLENNLRSVIFLSIGTLCLIGIVALLFVKPKDKREEK